MTNPSEEFSGNKLPPPVLPPSHPVTLDLLQPHWRSHFPNFISLEKLIRIILESYRV